MEVDRVMGSIYLADPSVDIHHLISISSYHTMKIHSILPNFWSHLLCPRCHGSTQWGGFSTPGSVICSHLISILLEQELLMVRESVWMSREVWQSVDGGLAAFYLYCFTTMASKWCISKFTRWWCPGAPMSMLDSHLRTDWLYVYMYRA